MQTQPLIRASTPDELAAGLERHFAVKGFDCPGRAEPFFAAVNRAALPTCQLHYSRYDDPVAIDFDGMTGLRQFFHLSGAGMLRVGAVEMPLERSGSGVIPDNNGFSGAFGPDYAHLVVVFDADAVQRKFECLQATDRSFAAVLPSLRPLRRAPFERLRSIALSLAHQFDGPEEPNRLVIAELEEALATSFILENLAAAESSPARAPTVRDRDVRRLEDYIRAHWDQPLTVESIAAACDVSVRSVYAGFKASRGTSPHAYLRQVRLEQARLQLSAAGPTLSVIEVALRCGFASFGHFARRYKEAFGELPSETLRRQSGSDAL